MISFISAKNGKLIKVIMDSENSLSYTLLRRLLRNKDIKVNGNRVKEDIEVYKGDKIDIYYCEKKPEIYSELFCDKNIVVINKKSGYESQDVFNSVKEKYANACFVHRLDRNTSGIMIFALNSIAETELLNGFKKHTFIKKYYATVKGIPQKDADILEGYLVKDAKYSIVKIYDKPIKDSVKIKTGYKVIEKYDDSSLLLVRLYTGKTHQIRAHLAHIGYPIIGDGKYGDNEFNKLKKAKYQMLVSGYLQLSFDKDSPLYYLDKKIFELEKP